MGYCYAKVGNRYQLICDVCGTHGNVRKYRCPFGYCQAIAACPKCRKEHPEHFSKATHRAHHCEELHNDFVAREKNVQTILDAGGAVRSSALSTGDNCVHVLFRRKDNSYIGFYMSADTYRALPLGVPATPDDFRKFGELLDAPDDFADGRTTKQVTPAGFANAVQHGQTETQTTANLSARKTDMDKV